MANKAAVDFGNSNTVLALWDEELQQAEVLRIPEFSDKNTFVIPSLIAYEPDGRFSIGEQTRTKASSDAQLFRWMKRYIGLRSPYALRIAGNRIDARQAAEDFLHTIAAASFDENKGLPDELIISVPVEAFEHYSEWLLSGMKRLNNMHIRLIDEASAAAAGYGLRMHPGDTLLVLDFGGSTLQAVCVSISEEGEQMGRCCHVLGKAGANLGGMTLDRWIFEDVLKRIGKQESDPQIRRCSGDLLRYCEEVKKYLSENDVMLFDFFPEQAFLITRQELEELFLKQGLFETMDMVIEEALRAAEDHGLVRDQLTAVLPVGGSCLLPMVREHLEMRFPDGKTLSGEPLGAVARGAAIIAGGMHIYDFIQHNYAIRYNDPMTGEYTFRIIVPRGTKYPASHVTPEMRLKAAYHGQQRFGIAIYELIQSSIQPVSSNEVFFDENGAVHVLPLTETELQSERLFWINERNPLFLRTKEAAEKGIPHFSVSFGIDANKMLTISAFDLVNNEAVLESQPVVRLN